MAGEWWKDFQREKEKRESMEAIMRALGVAFQKGVDSPNYETEDLVLVQEHKISMARVDSRREVLKAMAPGLSHIISGGIGLAFGTLVGVLIGLLY